MQNVSSTLYKEYTKNGWKNWVEIGVFLSIMAQKRVEMS
nr:MAG TPA: hypothetical protein [Caudoviricetes sp.]